MKPSVLKALDRVASLSNSAAYLVQQLVVQTSLSADQDPSLDNPVSEIQNRIADLQREISILRMESIPQEEPFTEDEYSHFEDSFTKYLTSSTDIKVTLQGFDLLLFKSHSPRVRVALANVLINFCSANNLTTPNLWRDIIAKAGYL